MSGILARLAPALLGDALAVFSAALYALYSRAIKRVLEGAPAGAAAHYC